MPTSTLTAIRNKVRRVTGRPSSAQITDAQIDEYVNTFYAYDLPAHMKTESLRTTWQFVTSANIPVYDFPRNVYLVGMPPVYVAGYETLMTQSRQNWFRLQPQLNYMQSSIATGNNTTGPYTFTLSAVPLVRGYKPNPPGAYSSSALVDIAAADIHWNVMISGTDNNGQTVVLVDDGGGSSPTGLGQLFALTDTSTQIAGSRGTVNYQTGAVNINAVGFNSAIANGAAINAQYIPYVASRPNSCVFYQDQITMWPIPDQAYTVSMEVYRRPSDLLASGDSPQLEEWWQLLAYGAADKVFADNADFENMSKFRPLLDEQMRLCMRRTICQYTSERTATIFTDQTQGSRGVFNSLLGI